jgi:hypothetical protein
MVEINLNQKANVFFSRRGRTRLQFPGLRREWAFFVLSILATVKNRRMTRVRLGKLSVTPHVHRLLHISKLPLSKCRLVPPICGGVTWPRPRAGLIAPKFSKILRMPKKGMKMSQRSHKALLQ